MQPLNFTERDIYNDFPSLCQAVMDHLDYKNWGFEIEVLHSVSTSEISSELLFQSDFCKFRIWTFRDRPYEPPEIYFAYGRLHAPNDKTIMLWNGQQCRCWHNHLGLYIALGFLEGLSPETVARKEFPHRPDVIEEFERKASGLKQHERSVLFHQTVWKHYQQRLFDLYDLRNPELWNQYLDFYQEFRSKITKMRSVYKANIC